jgi:hypothetical protein
MKKPFFAGFLENQIEKESTSNVQGGGGSPTSVIEDVAVTQKWPSDQEDNPTKPVVDGYQTMKYPSDGDDDINNV